MGSRAERLYATLPSGLQDVALTLRGWRQQRERLGGDFWGRLAAYRSRERVSEDELLAVRRARLREALRRAAEDVPFWGERFRRHGLDPERVEGPDDLRVLPVLTKAELVALGPGARWTPGQRAGIRWAHTSGTTGAGLVFPVTQEAVREQWAVWWRYRLRHGIEPGTWQATFAGRTLMPPGSRGRYWRVNWWGRQVLYSQYHLSPDTAPRYLEDLRRRGLPWFHGYPSLLSLVATHALARGVTLRPRWITAGAESLLEHQRAVIAEAFGGTPLEHYGLAEMVANASQCEAGRLHVDEDFAAVELLPAGDGTVRILGTGFVNRAFPLVRYDTGDLARLRAEGCPCGLPGRVLASVDGRQEDLVTLSDGSQVGRLDHLFKDMEWIAEAQIRQEHAGRCRIQVVPRPGFTEGDLTRLREECRARFGDRLQVEVEIVAAIPRTRTGKLRLVVREA
jgi:phenylacetate-CoA ligase